MKTILFAGLVIFFLGSCEKLTINCNLNPDAFTETYSWGNFPVVDDSSNKINAGIVDENGTMFPFAATALSTGFSRLLFTQSGDSSLFDIFGYKNIPYSQIHIRLMNILSTGTYQFGHIPGQGKKAIATFTTQGRDFLNDSSILSGSLIIDTFTANHIHATFNVTCVNGAQTFTLNDGSFAGNFY